MGISGKERSDKNIEIIDYEERYHEEMKRLSYEWLEKYDLWEPEDDRIIDNARELILGKGGFIFFARFEDEIVGTVSLIKCDETTFELAKLAVTAKYQGLKIGSKLMGKCISRARESGADKLILCTNHRLTSAIALYGKSGFIEVDSGDIKYQEADIKMELML